MMMGDIMRDAELVPFDDDAPAPAPAPPPPTGRQRAMRIGGVLLRLVLDAAVIDAAYETWLSPSPLRQAVAGVVGLYFGLTVYVMSKGGRFGGRGWLMAPAAPLVLLLGLLGAAVQTKEGAAAGLLMLRQPATVVLAGASLLVVVLAVWRLAGPSGFRPWWAKIPIVLVGAYAASAFVFAIRARTPYVALMAGDSFWRPLPAALRGAAIGGFVLPPAGLLREFGHSMVRLTVRGLLPWMLVFALGTWLAASAAWL